MYCRCCWNTKNTLFFWSMICGNQIEETIVICKFVNNFVTRYWYKMVATPCPRHRLWVCKAILQHERYPFLPGLHQKMWWKEFLLHIDQTLTVSSKFGDLSWLVAKNIHSASILKSCWSWYKLIKFLHLHCSA